MENEVKENIKKAVNNFRQKYIKEYESYIRENHNNIFFKFPLTKGFNIEVAIINEGIAIILFFIKTDQAGPMVVSYKGLTLSAPDPAEYMKKRGDLFNNEIQSYLNIQEIQTSVGIFAPFKVADENIVKLAHSTAKGHYIRMGELDKSKKEYFVAHEFSKANIDDLRGAIEEAFKDTGLKPYYADSEVRKDSHILKEKIGPKIANTRFGIYDISNSTKPNVFIELGVSIGLNKPYFLITRKGRKIPADLQGLDRIEYSSFKELTEKLKALIKIEE